MFLKTLNSIIKVNQLQIADWEPVWKRWVLNQNKYKKHLVKTTIDENIALDNDMIQTAKKHMDKDVYKFRIYKI